MMMMVVVMVMIMIMQKVNTYVGLDLFVDGRHYRRDGVQIYLLTA